MRIHLFLIVITIVMAFVLGRWSYLFRDQALYSSQSEQEASVENTLNKMTKTLKASGVIDFSRIYSGFDKKRLLDASLYRSGSVPKNEKIDCYQTKKESYKNFLHFFRKDLLWQQFQCSLIEDLPDLFFEYPPYMHPNGKSYLYLYYKIKGKELNRDWVEGHLNLFHILELKEIKKEPNIISSKLLDLLGSFNQFRLSYLLKLDDLILLDTLLLVKNFDSLSEGDYYIYDLSEFTDFLEKEPFTLTENGPNAKKCLLVIGNGCWDYSNRYLFQMVGSSSIYLFIATLVLLILALLVLVKGIKKDREDQEQRRQSLQILTHEFRTPVSAMLLDVEKIQQNFNHIGAQLQAPVLRLSNDVYRLQRLVEKSSSYLNLSRKKIFQFQLKKFDSVNDFITEIADHYFQDKLEEKQLKITLLQQDTYFFFDQHWMHICIRNLIDNSFAHGTPPVTLLLELSRQNELLIEISDQGNCNFKTIEQMCGDFVKSHKSKGLGLGLKIVKKIVKDLGGQFRYFSFPTRFQIQLNRHKLEKIFHEIHRA
ncbi:MAG: HAMP domain-containing histidine kinase [Oligoflexia bacterium]|nr:HAMP domain-containing histidine kinase [Oligoflexia bacterium]MBF0365028.1 HAMP domain-containing histidine kinase [Oligoflexia bacterium]